MIRSATLDDLDALVAIEIACFETDRLSRRSFRHLLTKGRAAMLVSDQAGVLTGYGLVLFHRGTSLARIYSLAVLPEHRKGGVARALVRACEQRAVAADCVYMRLEIRTDNLASQRLFRTLGYRQFGSYHNYYEDDVDALRFERLLVPHLEQPLAPVPYYSQTLDFTCGPASLMMAMKHLNPTLALSRSLEIRIWRESTTVFMTAGHGGCGPFGLALSAFHRGFDVELFINDETGMFVDSVRSAEKKEVVRLVQEDMLNEIRQLPIQLNSRRITPAELKDRLDQGAVAIILISSYRIYKEKFPHWVVVTGYDERFFYVHDPFIDSDKGKTLTDCVNMPILQQDFEHMSRYGKSSQRAALILNPGKPGGGI